MKYRHIAFSLMLLMLLSSCTGRTASETPPASISSDASESASLSEANSSSTPSEPEQPDEPTEPIYIESLENLQQQPEFQEAKQQNANVISFYLPESTMDAEELSLFLRAYEGGSHAVLELYDFSFRDYSFYRLETEGGAVKNKGWIRQYGASEPEQSWDFDGITFMDLLSTGDLFLRDGRQIEEGSPERFDLNLYVYNSSLQDEFVQTYETYFRTLEFNHFLGDQPWDINTVDVPWDFYFEAAYRQEYRVDNIWADYPTGDFPADIYEATIQKHFPISSERIRNRRSSYNAETNCYHYDGGRGGFYYSTTRILQIEEQDGKLLLTYSFDQGNLEDMGYAYEYETVNGHEQIKRGAERYQLVVERTPDGFHYVSNAVLPT